MGRINELTIKPTLTEGDIIPIWDSRAGRTRAIVTDSLKDFIKIEAHTDTYVESGVFSGNTLTLTMNDKTTVSISGFDFTDIETEISAVKGDVTKNANDIKSLDQLKADHLLLKSNQSAKTIEYQLRSGDTELVDNTLDLSGWFTENPVVGMHFVGIYQTLGALETAFQTPAANMQAIVIDPSEKYYHAVGGSWIELAPVATFHNGYVGVFDSLVLLRQAVPAPNANDVAIVGTTNKSFYYYDGTLSKWTLINTIDLTDLNNRVGQNQSEISALQTDNTKNKQDIITAQSGVNGNNIELAQHDNDIGLLQTFKTVTEPKINSLETVTDSNVNRIKALENDPRHDQIEPRVAKNEQDINTLNNSVSALGGDVSQLQNQVYTGNKVIGEDGTTLNDITGFKFDGGIVSDDDGDYTATITIAPKFTVADGQGISSKSFVGNALIFPDATLFQDPNDKDVITVNMPDEFTGTTISDDKQHNFDDITNVQFEHCTVRSDTKNSVVVTVDPSSSFTGTTIQDSSNNKENDVTDITFVNAALSSSGPGKATITISPDNVYPGNEVTGDNAGDYSGIKTFNFVNATVTQSVAGSATITIPPDNPFPGSVVKDETSDTYQDIKNFKFVGATVSQATIGEAIVTITPDPHYTGNVVKNEDDSVDISDVTDFIFVGSNVVDLGSGIAQITPNIEFQVTNEGDVPTVAKSLKFPGATITPDSQDASKIIVDMPDVYGGNDVADSKGADFQGVTKFSFDGATVTTADAGKTAVVTVDHLPADITVTDGKQTTFTGTSFVFPDRTLTEAGGKITIGKTDTPTFDPSMFESAVNHGYATDNQSILTDGTTPGWWIFKDLPTVRRRPEDSADDLYVFKQVSSLPGYKPHGVIMCFGVNKEGENRVWVAYRDDKSNWTPYLELGGEADQGKIDQLVQNINKLQTNDADTKALLTGLQTKIGDVYAPDKDTFDSKVNDLIQAALKHHVPEGLYPAFYASYGPKYVTDLTGLLEVKTGKVDLNATGNAPYYLFIFVLNDLDQDDRVKGWKLGSGQVIGMSSEGATIDGKRYRKYSLPAALNEQKIVLEMGI